MFFVDGLFKLVLDNQMKNRAVGAFKRQSLYKDKVVFKARSL